MAALARGGVTFEGREHGHRSRCGDHRNHLQERVEELETLKSFMDMSH